MIPQYLDVVFWLAFGERGLSSEALAHHLSGLPIVKKQQDLNHTPRDSYDFRRCLLMLEACPSIASKLHTMATVSHDWARLVTFWEDLRKIMDQENPDWRTKPYYSARLHRKMQTLRD